jgi:TM2 domain-containing membrane protein YozV
MRNKSPRSKPKSSGPRPEIAFRLSVVVPGLGQIYAGAPLRGALFFGLASLGLSGILESVFDPVGIYSMESWALSSLADRAARPRPSTDTGAL